MLENILEGEAVKILDCCELCNLQKCSSIITSQQDFSSHEAQQLPVGCSGMEEAFWV